MKYAMGSRTKYLYEIYIKNIKLGKLSLEMTDKSRIMIIDCGSTRSYVGKSFYQPIKDQVSIISMRIFSFTNVII